MVSKDRILHATSPINAVVYHHPEIEGVTKWAADQPVSGAIVDKPVDEKGFVKLPSRYREER